MINIRAMEQQDRAFVYSTMLKGLFFGCELYSQIEPKAFYDNYSKVVDALLDSSEVRVAVLAETPDVILGYSITNGPILHWVFVKKAWRGQGIAKQLVGTITTVTHLTKPGQAIKIKKQLTFNPFVLGGNNENN